ncbi:hypothetical protein OXX80_003057 [Metschnikowia pulcherrima]
MNSMRCIVRLSAIENATSTAAAVLLVMFFCILSSHFTRLSFMYIATPDASLTGESAEDDASEEGSTENLPSVSFSNSFWAGFAILLASVFAARSRSGLGLFAAQLMLLAPDS